MYELGGLSITKTAKKSKLTKLAQEKHFYKKLLISNLNKADHFLILIPTSVKW